MTFAEKLRKRARRLSLRLATYGREPYDRQEFVCPICNYDGPFKPRFGHNAIRLDAHCPQCSSLERHRHLALWLAAEEDTLFGDVLHFAPERQLRDLITKRATTYTTADIRDSVADLVLNIEALEIADSSYDTIFCNHVLEHVDDRKALAELHRILRPGGRAILTFPMIATWEQSYEDADIVSEQDRHRHFGQSDHVRYFGTDAYDRINAAGFTLEKVPATGAEAAKYALSREDIIFVCKKSDS